jgi:hypothetical protein
MIAANKFSNVRILPHCPILGLVRTISGGARMELHAEYSGIKPWSARCVHLRICAGRNEYKSFVEENFLRIDPQCALDASHHGSIPPDAVPIPANRYNRLLSLRFSSTATLSI